MTKENKTKTSTKKRPIFLGKLSATIEADWDNMPEVSQNYIINYGLKQSLNDRLSEFKTADMDSDLIRADAHAAVDARLAGLMSGNIPKGGGGGTSDPVVAMARTIATNRIKDLIRAKGLTIKTVTETTPMAVLVQRLLETDETIMVNAAEMLEIENEVINEVTGLDDLLSF